jgi:hypothetical protein
MKTPFLLILAGICLFPAISKAQMDPGINMTAAPMQMSQTDQARAGILQTQMAADIQRQQMERWRILQDVQTRIFEIQQDVTLNRARTQDRMFNTMNEYIRGGAPAPGRDIAAPAQQAAQQAAQQTMRQPAQGSTMPGGRCTGPCPTR